MMETATIKQIVSTKKIRERTMLLFTLIMLCSPWNSISQQAVTPAGGNFTGQGGSVSFTVGQIVYTAVTGPEHVISQGVQQPFEISVVTSATQIPLISLGIQAFPNPATSYLMLKVELPHELLRPLLDFELSDMNGRLLERRQITAELTNITMSHLVPGIYFLKVMSSGEENHIPVSGRASSPASRVSSHVKTFKIIKN